MSTYFETGEIILDTNIDDDTSLGFSATGSSELSFYVTGDSGAHTTHKVALQVSPDGGDSWRNAGDVTGLGFLGGIKVIADEVRLKVTKPEGSPSSCKCYIFGV